MHSPENSDPVHELSFLDVPDLPVDGAPIGVSVTRLQPTPDRRTHRLRRAQALTLAGTWLGAHVLVHGVRNDLAELPGTYAITQIVLPVGLALASLFVALRRGRMGLGVSRAVLRALGIGGPTVFTLVALSAQALPSSADSGGNFWPEALVCLDFMFTLVAVPLLVSVWALWGAFPTQAKWRSALVGAGCALLSGATLNLHCASGCAMHLFIGHGIPVVLASVIGGLLVTRWTQA